MKKLLVAFIALSLSSVALAGMSSFPSKRATNLVCAGCVDGTDLASDINVSGTVTATTFSGDGSSLTNLPVSLSDVNYASNTWFSAGSTTSILGSSSFTVAAQGVFYAGRPLRWRETAGGAWRYSLVADYTATTVTVTGASITATVAEIQYCDYSRTVPVLFTIPGYFADGADASLLKNDLSIATCAWTQGPAHLVYTRHQVITGDAGTESGINVRLNLLDYLSAYEKVDEAGVTTPPTNVQNQAISFGQQLELEVDNTGTNDDAKDLTVQLLFVLD